MEARGGLRLLARISVLLVLPVFLTGIRTGEDTGPGPGEPDSTLVGPAWTLELVGLRQELTELVSGWVALQDSTGRFGHRADSSGILNAYEASAEVWARSFAVVRPWVPYLSTTGDQTAFRSFLGLCMAFGDQWLADTLPAAGGPLPEDLRPAAGTLLSYSYLLVPGGPALGWLRGLERRWDWDPEADRLALRLQLALLRQDRDSVRAERIRALLGRWRERSGGEPADLDLLLDLVLADATERAGLLERVREGLARALATRAGAPTLLAEVFLRWRFLSWDPSLDDEVMGWRASVLEAEPEHPLLVALEWFLSEDETALVAGLRRARTWLAAGGADSLAWEGDPWTGPGQVLLEAFDLLSLTCQGGLGSRDGRIPDQRFRFRDAVGAPGLRPTVGARWRMSGDGEAELDFWQAAGEKVTVWVEPAREGAKLGRSWWRVVRPGGEERWVLLPYVKIGRIGPLVLGPRKPLTLRFQWTPGASYLEQWSRPAPPRILLGPGGPATRQ
jgi:hypothetical protein